MFDIGGPELFVIAVVALVAIGPQDLPKALYTLGRFAGKIGQVGRDIRGTLAQLDVETRAAEQTAKSEQDHDKSQS